MLLINATIKNIKSYYPEQTITFGEKIHIYVGPNGGGKSNLFEVLQGTINNIFYKHVIVELNGDRNNQEHANRGKSYRLRQESFDQLNYSKNIIDKHFNHL